MSLFSGAPSTANPFAQVGGRRNTIPIQPSLEVEGFGARCKHTSQSMTAHGSAIFGTGRCRESAASPPIREAWPGFAGSASLSIAAGCPIRQSSKKDKAAVVADGRFGRGAQTRLNAPRLLSFSAPCGAPRKSIVADVLAQVFLNARGLAFQVAQVIQLRTAHLATTLDRD